MTHIPGMPIPFEDPTDWKPSVVPRDKQRCGGLKCEAPDIWWREHSSSCGGWDDTELMCRSCGYTWWVDGIDS